MPCGRERQDHQGGVEARATGLGRRQSVVPGGVERRKPHVQRATDVERDVALRSALSDSASCELFQRCLSAQMSE